MKIKAGNETVDILDVRVTGDYAVLSLAGVLTPAQAEALTGNKWEVFVTETNTNEAGELVEMERKVAEYTNYDEVIEASVTLKRSLSLQDEVIEQKKAIEQQTSTIKEIVKFAPDDEAVKYAEYFEPYEAGKLYPANSRFNYNGHLYKVLTEHTSQADWLPDKVATLYSIINDPNTTEIPEWQAGLTYAKDTEMAHNGKVYVSMVDSNTWEPGADGVYDNIWKEKAV